MIDATGCSGFNKKMFSKKNFIPANGQFIPNDTNHSNKFIFISKFLYSVVVCRELVFHSYARTLMSSIGFSRVILTILYLNATWHENDSIT